MLKQPGHLTSMKYELGLCTRRLSLCLEASSEADGCRRSRGCTASSHDTISHRSQTPSASFWSTCEARDSRSGGGGGGRRERCDSVDDLLQSRSCLSPPKTRLEACPALLAGPTAAWSTHSPLFPCRRCTTTRPLHRSIAPSLLLSSGAARTPSTRPHPRQIPTQRTIIVGSGSRRKEEVEWFSLRLASARPGRRSYSPI